ncbi:hypothetical protein FA13DRAFT_1713880 [Coprinellus micaceus]|uniref:Uncharacterized protein n=1 Tax=Coprinellus micaceus TaxID=71717 RepID=A0A4Y7SUU9_COPMI|nr:hypothetical protein FA13DRAFT_1713880 [Coprinellus micaceus]
MNWTHRQSPRDSLLSDESRNDPDPLARITTNEERLNVGKCEAWGGCARVECPREAKAGHFSQETWLVTCHSGNTTPKLVPRTEDKAQMSPNRERIVNDLGWKDFPGRGVSLCHPGYLQDCLLIPPLQEIQYHHLPVSVLQQYAWPDRTLPAWSELRQLGVKVLPTRGSVQELEDAKVTEVPDAGHFPVQQIASDHLRAHERPAQLFPLARYWTSLQRALWKRERGFQGYEEECWVVEGTDLRLGSSNPPGLSPGVHRDGGWNEE